LHSIAGRLVIWFLLIGLVPCLVLALFQFRSARAGLREATVRTLDLLLDGRIEAIDTYTRERVREVDVISKGPSILLLLKDFQAQPGADPAARPALEERARTVLRRFLDSIGHANAMLLDPGGRVLYSVEPGFNPGQDLRDGPFRETPLSKALSTCLATTPPTISVPDYYPSLDRDHPLIFVMQTVLDEGRLAGVLVFELAPGALDVLFTRGREAGRDAAVYAGRALGNEAVILAPLQVDAAGAAGGGERRFALGEPAAPALQAAVKGRRGSADTADRLGRPAVAAWGYSRGLDLGIVAEIEAGSAYGRVAALQRLTAIALALAAGLIVAFALVAARSIARPIRRLIGHAQESIVTVVSSSLQIAATAREQERVAQDHEASMVSVAAAINEISATSQELSRLMGRAHDAANHVAALATGGKSGLSGLHEAMQGLAASAGSFGSRLSVISDRAKTINVAVTTITKVADQTNLLSINAAIEAEKAGEAGRGFLVVAREIRRLADQTAVATLEIERVVSDMQQGVSAGVMEMDRFHEQVRREVAHVEGIGGQLGEVIGAVEGLLPELQQVHEGMAVQAQGAGQIREAAARLKEGAARTAASAREAHEASESLRQSIGRLQEDIALVPT
jgi:methyl-accepting chemotaxis protein WspA